MEWERYCLEKSKNFRKFGKWTTRVTLTRAPDADDWQS